jgi:hypothetical protein
VSRSDRIGIVLGQINFEVFLLMSNGYLTQSIHTRVPGDRGFVFISERSYIVFCYL